MLLEDPTLAPRTQEAYASWWDRWEELQEVVDIHRAVTAAYWHDRTVTVAVGTCFDSHNAVVPRDASGSSFSLEHPNGNHPGLTGRGQPAFEEFVGCADGISH